MRAYKGFYDREILYQRGSHRLGTYRGYKRSIVEIDIGIETVYTVGLLIVAVIIQFVHHINGNQQADGQPGGQPDNINGGKTLVFPEVSQACFKVISEHSSRFLS